MKHLIDDLCSAVLLVVFLIAVPAAGEAQQQTGTVSVADRGCYADNQTALLNNPGGHDLDGAAFSEPAMTVQMCFGLCYQQGYRIAGLQAGTQCFCGDAYGRFGSAAGACTIPCAGDPSQTCGGNFANHVYEFVTTQAGVPAQAPSASVAQPSHDDVNRSATFLPVGQWPEGIAWDGTSLWVAESGQRRLAQLAESGTVLQHVTVGRLPVDLAATPNGHLYATVATDKMIWQQFANEGRTLVQLQHYPQALDADDGAVFVLVWIDGASEQTQVVRIDPTTGQYRVSPVLPKNGFDLALAGNRVWVLHRYDGEDRSELLAMDRDSLEVATRIPFPGFATFLTAGNGGLYAAGGEAGGTGLVVAFDPQTGQELVRNEDIAPVGGVAVEDGYVIAVENEGAVEILSASDLSPVRTIELTSGGIEPRDVLPLGQYLFMTTHRGLGDGGSVAVVSDWRP